MRNRGPFRILIVEDNHIDVSIVKEGLQPWEHQSEFLVCADGVDAIRRLTVDPKFRPDLILLDMNLPKKSGHEVLGQIKADDALRSIPVVMMSSSGAQKDVDLAYSLHANSYFTKPFEVGDFIARINALGAFWLDNARLP